MDSAFVYGNPVVLRKLYKYTFLESSFTVSARHSSIGLSLRIVQAATALINLRHESRAYEADSPVASDFRMPPYLTNKTSVPVIVENGNEGFRTWRATPGDPTVL